MRERQEVLKKRKLQTLRYLVQFGKSHILSHFKLGKFVVPIVKTS